MINWRAALMVAASLMAPMPVAQADDDTTAKVLVRVAPLYSRSGAHSQIEGCVLVSFNLDSTGRPVDLQVEDSVPTNIFEKLALDAISQWEFEPPKVRCDSRYYQAMSFHLDSPGRIPVARPCNRPSEQACKIDNSAVQRSP